MPSTHWPVYLELKHMFIHMQIIMTELPATPMQELRLLSCSLGFYEQSSSTFFLTSLSIHSVQAGTLLVQGNWPFLVTLLACTMALVRGEELCPSLYPFPQHVLGSFFKLPEA